MNKITKGIVSFVMILVIAFTSYAMDVDTIFGIKASAATYKEKAQSMFEFYKNGAALDRTAISDDELYVFGVFVSNFLMPFQSNVGAMSSDAFVTKMCAMFFGDAYTAQQLADMKYTLGLVQTAQSTRAKMITRDGAPVSVDALYKNFIGFYSETLTESGDAKPWMQAMRSTQVHYTYEGAENRKTDIVWSSGITAFDVVLGQLISICPSQAGTYMGTTGNVSSSLYVDCFGNISDVKGVVIVPACMNPYSFYNRYLDANRVPQSTEGAACPLQLPLNNAFWMGTMLDPRDMTVLKEIKTTVDNVETSSLQLRYGYIALPNLYVLLENWTNSATSIFGLNSVDGDEIGIYFSTSIATTYLEAWRAASGQLQDDTSLTNVFNEWMEKGPSAITQYPGLIPVANYIGGTAIPVTSVLDDIVLFDTYNTFSESLSNSIHVMSMFTDDAGSWWGEDPSHGVMVPSLIRGMMSEMTQICEKYVMDSSDSTSRPLMGISIDILQAAGQKCIISGAFVDYIDTEEDKFSDAVVNKLLNTVIEEAEKNSSEIQADTLEYLTDGSFVSLSTDEDEASEVIDVWNHWRSSEMYKTTAWRDGVSSGQLKNFAKRLLLSVLTGEPTFMFNAGDNGDGDGAGRAQWVIDSIVSSSDMRNGSWWAWDDANDGGAIVGNPIKEPSELTNVGWFGSTSWFSHYCFQKAHPAGATLESKSSFFASLGAVACWIVAGVAFVASIIATGGLSLVLTIVAVGVAIGAAALTRMVAKSSMGSKSSYASGSSESGGLDTVTAAFQSYMGSLTRADIPTRYVNYIAALADAPKGLWRVVGSQAQNAYKYLGMEISSDTELKSILDEYKSPLSAYFIMGYGHTDIVDAGKHSQGSGDKVAPCAVNYVLNYSLYGPHKGLASSLAAVSKVYTENGIVDGNKVSKKVGSYITNDVNMWGGIYYAYMIDILGLNFEGETLKAAQLKTNFPDVSTSMTNKNTLNLQGLLDAGTEEDAEAAETEKRRSLMDRLDELTNLTSSEYRNKLMTQTTNSWLVSTHASICGASESGSTQNIGSGSRYTGYSGYVTTSTLSEMPFTSWVMQYYNIIYAVLLVIIIVLAICMAITGHRSFRMCVFSVVCMAVTLLIPRLSIDTAVAATNNLASDLYKDRFNFWAYSQHLMYLQDLQNTTSEYEFLIVTNMQQAKDYYDSENGVTLKWMSPKKSSYWDSLVGTVEIEGADSDYSGLNLSIFTWLFQGQFRQETYSTDPMATYLYRPYLDIVMTASSNAPVTSLKDGIPALLSNSESSIPRESYAAHTAQAWKTAEAGIISDWDIKPLHRTLSLSTGRASSTSSSSGDVTSASSLTSLNSTYSVGVITPSVTNVAYGNYVDYSDVERYKQAYPNSVDTVAGIGGQLTFDLTSDASRRQFYLYTESPYYYFYYMFKNASKRYTGSDDDASGLLLSKDFFKYRSATFDTVSEEGNPKHAVTDDTLMDFLDLEGLFTYVIPYLRQANMYADEWMTLNGREVTAASEDYFKKNLKGIWQMYSPWVDAMYDTTYADGKIRSGGKSYKLKDAINPGYYTDIRPMVFSPADMQRNFVTSSDLSDVESRIMRVLENTYVDLMYLNNYTSFDDEVLFSAMAMTATFNFNKEFSDTALFGENITLYPVGFEVRNFNYDAFLRLALLNTTGESIFSDADIYTTVIENTSFFTGVLLILNDIVAVYVVPAMKLVVLLALFFLGLLVCMFAFVTPPDGIWKWIGKNYLLPYGIFVAALVAHMLVVSLFVGEGVTSVVGQRGITVTTGDPTITIILMLVVNIIYAFGLFQVLRLQLKSFKVSLTGIGAAALGFVAGAAGFVMGQIKGGLGALAGGGRSIGRGIGGRISRNMQRNADAKAYAKANAKYGGLSGDSSGDAAPEAASGRRNGTEEYKGLQRTKAGLGDTSSSSTTSMSHADKIAAKREKYADDVATARAANERDTPVSTSGLIDAQKEHISARSQRMKDDYASKKQSLADMKASYAAKNDEKLNSALEKSAAKTQAAKTKTTARYAAATMRAAEMFGTDSEQYKRIVSKQEAAATKSAERIAAAERKREEKIATQAAAREERANDKVWQKDAALEIKTARLREKIANSSGRYAKLNNAVRTTKQTAQNVAADAKFAARSAADYARSAGATASEGLRSAGRTASSAARSAVGTVSSGVRTAAGAVSSAGKAAVKTSSAAVRTAASGARAVASAGKA